MDNQIFETYGKWFGILRGKARKENLYILEALALNGAMTTGQLAAKIIEREKVASVSDISRAQKQRRGSTIYRRLKDLNSLGYTKKLGHDRWVIIKGNRTPLYSLTFKGIMALYTISNIARENWQMVLSNHADEFRAEGPEVYDMFERAQALEFTANVFYLFCVKPLRDTVRREEIEVDKVSSAELGQEWLNCMYATYERICRDHKRGAKPPFDLDKEDRSCLRRAREDSKLSNIIKDVARGLREHYAAVAGNVEKLCK